MSIIRPSLCSVPTSCSCVHWWFDYPAWWLSLYLHSCHCPWRLWGPRRWPFVTLPLTSWCLHGPLLLSISAIVTDRLSHNNSTSKVSIPSHSDRHHIPSQLSDPRTTIPTTLGSFLRSQSTDSVPYFHHLSPRPSFPPHPASTLWPSVVISP